MKKKSLNILQFGDHTAILFHVRKTTILKQTAQKILVETEPYMKSNELNL